MKGKYLITTDAWFVAPDGKQYRSVWGECEVIDDTFLGVKTNRNSSNWFVKVGSEDKHIIVAGCQIHYSVKCENKPIDTRVSDWRTAESESEIIEYERPSMIYIAE